MREQKTIQVRFQIEASIDVDVPSDATPKQIERIVKTELHKETGGLYADISSWAIEED